MEQQAVIKTVGGQSPCKTCPHGEFLRIANPYIHLRRMTYPPERVHKKRTLKVIADYYKKM